MPLLLRISILVCFLTFSSANLHTQTKDTNFPTDDEIKLLLAQADRAMQQYKPLLDQEQETLGEKGAQAVSKDRQVIEGIEMAIKAFEKNPQAFNGPLGFAFFEWLDDADRNALLCATTSSNDAATKLLAGETAKAQTEIHLAQSCLEASNLIYTVSENAGALYTRYVQGEEKLANEGARVAQKCAEILKQKIVAPKQ